MFREAYAKAKHYTRPVAGVTRTVGGQCTSGIASFVVINKEGWILTAYHTSKTLTAIREIQLKTQSYFESLASIRADAALSQKEAKARVRALGLPQLPKMFSTSLCGEAAVKRSSSTRQILAPLPALVVLPRACPLSHPRRQKS